MAVVENREALSQIMVNIQLLSSTLDSFSIPVPVPPTTPHASLLQPTTSSTNAGFPPATDNLPKAFKFSFPHIDGYDLHEWLHK